MRLLKCDNGKISLTKDLNCDIPQYAILSHTWGPDEEEVTYRDMVDGTWVEKAGYKKIRFCAKQAMQDGLRHFWVDTCCIDRSNYTELNESINCMFSWYQNAARCYVYLADVSISNSLVQSTNPSKPPPRKKQKLTVPATSSSIHCPNQLWELTFQISRWFTRGWTLQELLAPVSVEFFSRDGLRLGDKKSLEQQIHKITGIPVLALQGAALSEFDIKERFRWAEDRQTTREEDGVYCLLGIFSVFMPLIYGEKRANALRRLEAKIKKREGAPTTPLFPTIPFRRDPDFVNRGDILDQIDKRCSEPAGRVALVGLGGIGKSQLAIEFAHRVDERVTRVRVFWIHASTRARVEESLRTIADAVKLPGREQPKADIPHLLYSWLSQEGNGQWIMILDSADDADVFYGATVTPDSKPLASYLPQSRNGSILVTTRNKDLARRLTGHNGSIEVGTMVEAEALSLLEKKLGTTELNEATELVRALEYVPLAINQAAGYIRARAPRSSLKKYLADFREGEHKRTRLLGHDGGDLRRDGSASNSVLTTWQISFEHIHSKRRSAADLLSLMSFFDRQGIPESLLKPTDPTVDMKKGEESDPGCGDEEMISEFEDDVVMLQDFCFITANENKNEFEMHGLVQLSTRRWLEAKGLQEEVKEQYLTRMGASFPRGDYENWTACRKLFAHVEAAINYKPVEQGMEKTWATLLFNGAWYARLQGRYDIAEQMARKAKRSREKLLGEEDISTLSGTSLFALVLLDKGQWNEAEELFMQVMEASKKKLGADHPNTLSIMANLASTFWNQGQWEAAEELEVQVIEANKKKLGADHPNTLISMANLASTYRNQGRWEAAEELDIQVMEARKKKLGADHPNTLTSMANLALTFWNQGRWEAAEKLFMQVIEARKKKLGADHPDTLTSMANLASTFWNQGRWEAAEELEVQVIEARKKKLGADHPNTLTSMANLASTFWNQGRWEAAEKLFMQVIEARKKKLGADHPDTLSSMANLASTFWNQGRWEAAEELFMQVIEACKKKLGADHPNTLISMANLASTYRNQGRWEAAEELDIQVMEACKKKLGADHPDTLSSMANLASTYRNQGRWEAAEELFMQVIEARKKKLGADHPDTLSSMANLASTYRNQGRWEAAEELEVQVIEAYKKKLGADHPDTLSSMNGLALTWECQGRHVEASALMESCVKARQRVLGPQHPYTLSSMATLDQWRARMSKPSLLVAQE